MDGDMMQHLHQYGIKLDDLVEEMFDELKTQRAIEPNVRIEGYDIKEVDGHLRGPVQLSDGNGFMFDMKIPQQ